MEMNKKQIIVGISLIFFAFLLIPNVISTNLEFIATPSQKDSSTIQEDLGTLSGYATDAVMNPIEGARTRVYFHDTYRENYSDATGYYHVTDISICNCTKNCTCIKQGYYPEWVYLSIEENTTYDFILTPKGQWYYVGGTGPNNYTKIQDAIDNTTNGDTVIVYPGIYNETLEIHTSIQLQGTNPLTTCIDGQNNTTDVITCAGTDTIISGFTIAHCTMNHSCVLFNHTTNCTLYGNLIHTGEYAVTMQNAQNISIINNTFLQILSTQTGYIAIRLIQSKFCTVSQNTISSWTGGILLSGSHHQITKNTITNTDRGITDMMNTLPGATMYLAIDENHLENNKIAIFLTSPQDYSITHNIITNATTVGVNIIEEVISGLTPKNITIQNNLITDSAQAMVIENAINLSIKENDILHNTIGFSFYYCSDTSVENNTFQDNDKSTDYLWAVFPVSSISRKVPRFDMNFWNQPQKTPYPIFGRWGLLQPDSVFDRMNILPWMTFDWHPAIEPYEKGEIL
jgi:parallel beta-helix repeat protein